jgi:tRNA threonylcarbamoyladenosine biosynthesis protein TsaE
MRGAIGITTESPEQTRVLGVALASLLLPGDVVSLNGDLGAGKTLFVQGAGSALGVRRRITSPTFALVHEYEARYPILHVDVYRLNSLQEVLDLGFEDLLDRGAIVFVEWGRAVTALLPARRLDIEIRQIAGQPADMARKIMFRPHGDDWVRKLGAMRDIAETMLSALSPDESPPPRFVDAAWAPPREHMNRGDEPFPEV